MSTKKTLKVNNKVVRYINNAFVNSINGVQIQPFEGSKLSDKVFAFRNKELYCADKDDLDNFTLFATFSNNINGIAYGNDTLAILLNTTSARNNIRYLTEGSKTWQEVATGVDYLNTLKFNNGIFMAGKVSTSSSTTSTFIKSTNLTTWTSVSSQQYFSYLAVINNNFLRVSSTNYLSSGQPFGYYYSTDGGTWNKYQAPYEYSSGAYVTTAPNTYIPLSGFYSVTNVYRDLNMNNNTVTKLVIETVKGNGSNKFIKTVLNASTISTPTASQTNGTSITGKTKFLQGGSNSDIEIYVRKNRAVLPNYTFASASGSESYIAKESYNGEYFINLSTLTYSKLFDARLPEGFAFSGSSYTHGTRILYANDDYAIIKCEWSAPSGGTTTYRYYTDYYLWKFSNNQVTLMNSLPQEASNSSIYDFGFYDVNN